MAPRESSRASASAIASACGRPPGWVQPRPTTRPSFTITQPTWGLGAVRPRPRSPSATAAAFQRLSSGSDAELALKLFELPLTLDGDRILARLPLLLRRCDLGVGTVVRERTRLNSSH